MLHSVNVIEQSRTDIMTFIEEASLSVTETGCS